MINSGSRKARATAIARINNDFASLIPPGIQNRIRGSINIRSPCTKAVRSRGRAISNRDKYASFFNAVESCGCNKVY